MLVASNQFLHAPAETRLSLLDSLRELTRPPARRSAQMMTADELVRLASGGLVEIGAHTVTHASLPTLTSENQMSEMLSGTRVLEALLERPVEAFAYPYGDLDGETVTCVREAGFTCAVTTARAPVSRDSDPIRLPRLHVLDWSEPEFEGQLGFLLRSRATGAPS